MLELAKKRIISEKIIEIFFLGFIINLISRNKSLLCQNNDRVEYIIIYLLLEVESASTGISGNSAAI